MLLATPGRNKQTIKQQNRAGAAYVVVIRATFSLPDEAGIYPTIGTVFGCADGRARYVSSAFFVEETAVVKMAMRSVPLCPTLPLRVGIAGASLTIATALCLLLLPHAKRPASDRPAGACLSSAQAAVTMRDLCLSLGAAYDPVTRPVFVPVSSPTERAFAVRPTWRATRNLGGNHVAFVINDRTNKLCTVAWVWCPESTGEARGRGRSASPQQAAETAVRYLRQLQMTPPGTLIALHADPRLDDTHQYWETKWDLRERGGQARTSIRVRLDRRTGLPLYISDKVQMLRYTDDLARNRL